MMIDILVVIASLSFSVYIRPTLNNISIIKYIPEGIGIPLTLYIMFPCVTVIIFSSFSLYDGKKLLRAVDEFSVLTFAFLVLSIALAGILYLSFREVSRALFFFFIFISYCGFLFWRVLARGYFRLRKEQLNVAERRMLLVGAGSLGQKVYENIITQSIENLCIVGYIDDDCPQTNDSGGILGGTEDIRRIVQEHGVTDVIMALPHSAYQKLTHIVSLVEDAPVRIWIALGFFDLALYKLDIANVTGIPMLDLRASALSENQLQVKRAFDLILASLAVVISLPLMGIISISIWLQDHGPIIFKQQRVGENGRLFTIYKFRTMVPGAEFMNISISQNDGDGNHIHKTRTDSRVTPVGHFLRRFSLDELPQLFNVIEGTMSMVGPRPELPYLVEKYQTWQRKRFAVPPGMTGWWQVNGRSDRMMHLHTEDDIYYVENYSIWLDIQILIRTLWVVFIGKGSY
jgi:exopolysaccharide biosynthesis polyprenyl glycosylphosphotransferase